MAKLPIFIWLALSSLLATAQQIEATRLLTSDYQAQSLEQALTTLTATNTVDAPMAVEYKAGQSVVLRAGFEAKVGSVFTAQTGPVSALALGEGMLSLLAYPNPFVEVTTISYVLPRAGRTSVQIRDPEGKLVSQLVDGQYQEAGRHSVEWSGAGVAVGTYVCIIETGTQRLSRRIIRK